MAFNCNRRSDVLVLLCDRLLDLAAERPHVRPSQMADVRCL